MRNIRDCSSPWKGTWVQRDVSGTMQAFRLLFTGNSISGGGRDRHGAFTMKGTYDPQRTWVDLTKRYWHTGVRYQGVWNGSFVGGESIIGPVWLNERGRFEIWPADEDEAIEQIEENQSEERTLVGV